MNTRAVSRIFPPRRLLIVGMILMLAALLILLTASTAHAVRSYELAARISLSNGAISDVAWLDEDNYLTLVVTPAGAEVFRNGYDIPRRQRYMSNDFMAKYICPPEYAGRLHMTLSPAKRYLFFSWFQDNGLPEWRMVDVSDAPNFKLKHFVAPAGMKINNVVFSPDDRLAVFIHDSRGDCNVSLLVLDMETGSEAWRISTQELNFIRDAWWSGAILDEPRFYVAAKLHDGQFEQHHGLAKLDINARSLEFSVSTDGAICGSAALWGHLSCFAANPDASEPYFLRFDSPGQTEPSDILLSAEPVSVHALATPGLVLLTNTADWVTNQLWLINVFSGDKYLVDRDCASFSLTPGGMLLVRAQASIELKVYVPVETEYEAETTAVH